MNPDVVAAARAKVDAERAGLSDLSQGYPANHFAWRVVSERAKALGATSLVEVGVGRGNGVAHVLADGMRFTGLDRDEECVRLTRDELVAFDQDPDVVIHADVMDADRVPGAGTHDLLMALGIMPHADDQEAAIRAMAALVRPGGELFIEFRNSLFSLVTFNRLTHDFIADDLLGDVPSSTRERVSSFIEPRVEMSKPPAGSGALTSHQANPLALPAWLASLGFPEVTIHPFHFHAAMPLLEGQDPQEFRDASLALEDDSSGWRGLFLCSVFLARVVKPIS